LRRVRYIARGVGACLGLLSILVLAQVHAGTPKKPASHAVVMAKSAAQTSAAKPKVVATAPAPLPTPAPAAKPASAVASPKPVTHVAPPNVAVGTKPLPVVTPSPASSVSSLAPTDPAPAPSGGSTGSSSGGGSSSSTTTSYTSTNWSGYLATAGNYTTVAGSWHATAPTGNGSTTSADSTWIGIGGVTAGDLIQTGTQNTVSASGQVSTSAFYELLPDYAQTVPGITVTAGDSMSATITETAASQWTISITDNTNGQSYTKSVSYASSNSSAEWIEEDPSYSTHRQIPFDNFGSAAFTSGSTTANGNLVNIASANGQPVTMVNSSGQPIATPSALNGGSFTITQQT
jgi:hypothetical protein